MDRGSRFCLSGVRFTHACSRGDGHALGSGASTQELSFEMNGKNIIIGGVEYSKH